MGEHMVANHPNLASVSYMSAASSDLFFAVQQGLQVLFFILVWYLSATGTCQLPVPNLVSVSYMSAVCADFLFVVEQGLQVQ